MKKLFFILCLLPSLLWAAPVDPNMAQQVAENFINAPEVDANGVIKKAPQKRKQMARAAKQITADQQFYVFNSQDSEGFVIVAADDVARPILGYSHSENLDIENIPDNLRWWLSEYDRQIRWAQDNNIEQSEETAKEWQTIHSNRVKAASVVVAPLIQTKWNQGQYYNSKCPETFLGLLGEDGHVYTGCVATAMSQVMKYWNYPVHGTGAHTNTINETYGNLYANFAATNYQWNSMPIQLTANSTASQIDAVATLMYHCGVSVDMNYGFAGSGANPLKMWEALYTFFGYSSKMILVNILNHTTQSWMYVIQNQLNKNRPVLYSGNAGDNNEGHQFICDGYGTDGYFHFNWGWSGKADGYFMLSALTPDPSQAGAGAGSHNYTYNQLALVNIEPEGYSDIEDFQLFSDIYVSSTHIKDNEQFETRAAFVNIGQSNFQGNIYAALVNSNGNIVSLLDSLTNVNYPHNSSDTIIFSYNGIIDVPDGDYVLMMLYKKQGTSNYNTVGSDYFLNGLLVKVEHSFHLTPGKYVIVANRDKAGDRNWYYMTSDLGTASNKRFQAVNTETENIDDIVITELEDTYIWDLEADGTNWKLKNGDQYVSWSSGNATKFDATGKSLTFEVEENRIQAHFNDGTNERYLALNATTGNNYFAFYSGTNQQINLYFLPYEEEEPPVIPQPESDRYVVLAQRNASSNWFYMTSDLGTASNKRYQAVDAGTSTLSEVTTTNLEDKYYWEIEENKLKTGTQYSTWTSGNTANLDATGKELTIQQADGTYTFSFADGADTRYLALNATAGNDYFAYYKGTNQIYRLTLVKEGENGSTVGVENIVEQPSATKVLMNGQILILRGDKTYTLTGQEVK